MTSDYTFQAKILSQKVTYLRVRVSFVQERENRLVYILILLFSLHILDKRKMSTNRQTPFNKRTMPTNNNTHSIRKLNKHLLI
jgi:hypothetical protein